MYISDILKDTVLYMFDFSLPLVNFCGYHSVFSKEEKRNIEKEGLLFLNFAHSIGRD